MARDKGGIFGLGILRDRQEKEHYPGCRTKIAEFTAEEKGLIELTAERGERLDIPGVCIENAAFMRLRDEGIVKARPGEPVEQGRICHWSLTEKGKSLAKELDYKIKSDNPSNPRARCCDWESMRLLNLRNMPRCEPPKWKVLVSHDSPMRPGETLYLCDYHKNNLALKFDKVERL